MEISATQPLPQYLWCTLGLCDVATLTQSFQGQNWIDMQEALLKLTSTEYSIPALTLALSDLILVLCLRPEHPLFLMPPHMSLQPLPISLQHARAPHLARRRCKH